MSTNVPVGNNRPVKGSAFSFEVELLSQANTKLIQTSVTLQAGDVVVYKDGVLDGNIDALPVEIGTSGVLTVTLSATETNANRITVKFSDQAGAQWCDFAVYIETDTLASVAAAGDQMALTDSAVDAVWDEILTAATHNVPTSAGRRLRQLATAVIHDGTAVSATTNTITFNADASSMDGAYDPALICIVGGTGVGQSRLVYQYAGSTKTATVDRDWKVVPDNTSEFIIFADAGREHVNEGLIRAATSTTVQLNALGSTQDDAYTGQILFLKSGTGADQARRVKDYDGTTQTVTVDTWDVTPDATTGYVMLPSGMLPDSDIADAVMSATVPNSHLAGSAGYALGRIGTARISVVSPITTTGDVTTYRGNDNTGSNAISWTKASGAVWPSDLSGWTIAVCVAGLTFTGSVVVATGSGQSVKVELDNADTLSILTANYTYWVWATKESEEDALLVTGPWNSLDTERPA